MKIHFLFGLFLAILPLRLLAQQEDTAQVFKFVEQTPEYPGGQVALYQYLQTHVNYPELANLNGISGTVKVKFMVDTKGKVDSVQVVKSVHSLLDNAAMKAVAGMAQWKPGYNGRDKKGKKVGIKVWFQLPVTMEPENAPLATMTRYDHFPEPFFDLEQWRQLKAPEGVAATATNGVLIYIDQYGLMSGFDLLEDTTANWKTAVSQLIKNTNDKYYQRPWKPAIKNGEPVASEFLLPLQLKSNN